MKLTIDIGWPKDPLWPNGRTRVPAYRHRLVRQAVDAGYYLTRSRCPGGVKPTLRELGDPAPVALTVVYRSEAHRPDRDNCVAVCKPFFDGMAKALGIDDRHFAEPTVTFVKEPKGRKRIEIGIGA